MEKKRRAVTQRRHFFFFSEHPHAYPQTYMYDESQPGKWEKKKESGHPKKCFFPFRPSTCIPHKHTCMMKVNPEKGKKKRRKGSGHPKKTFFPFSEHPHMYDESQPEKEKGKQKGKRPPRLSCSHAMCMHI